MSGALERGPGTLHGSRSLSEFRLRRPLTTEGRCLSRAKVWAWCCGLGASPPEGVRGIWKKGMGAVEMVKEANGERENLAF